MMQSLNIKLLTAAILLLLNAVHAKAQHHTDSLKNPHDTIKVGRQPEHGMHHMPTDTMKHRAVPMSHSFSVNLPMSRNGSGTSWLPDASPMYGWMKHVNRWMYMFHGNVAPRYIATDIGNEGSRGDEKFSVPNWFMAMGQRKIGRYGLFHFNAMLSLDRLTEGGDGYPLLFQTGESWNNEPLVDKQHPHDLFSELSIGYTHSFSPKADLSLYAGYPGEPALGSVAFMHRPSALANPDAPISHHWNDGTHITFGVATLGFRYDKLKFEVSSFKGREPDEDRYAFDKPRFDSFSGRIQFNPTNNWAFQFSQGLIKSPEALHPEDDVDRTIVSAIYSRKIGEEKFFNATALWGLNKSAGHDGENAALLEASFRNGKMELYSRYEWVQKSTEELNLDENAFGEGQLHPVNALTFGLHYDVLQMAKLRLAAGTQITAYDSEGGLRDLYGKNPFSGQVFFRIYPALMGM